MAITIKTVPILKKEVAVKFNKRAKASIAQKSSVKFSKQVELTAKILAKAKT